MPGTKPTEEIVDRDREDENCNSHDVWQVYLAVD